MQKPKILILSLTYFLDGGGAEVAIKEITDRLTDDFEFDLLCAKLDKKLPKFEKIGNINVYRIGFGFETLDKYIFTFLGFCKAIRLHWKKKYKIIWPSMAAYSSFAVLFKIFTRAKVVLTLQEGDPIEYIVNLKRFKIFRPIYKIYFKTVDKVQVISNFLATWAESLGIKKEKIIVVPNGVTINVQRPLVDKQQKLKEELNIKDDEKIILTVSRLVEKNGVEDLIKSIAKFPGDENYKLLIIGNGPLRNKLEKITEDLKKENKVIFLGRIENAETLKYYTLANVFVRPSLSEGFGNVFVEAMAYKVPVIATPVGGIPDFLKDAETGWFCKVNDPQSIAEKIQYILNPENSDEVVRVVNNARHMVEEKYDWNIIAKQMKNIFTKLINDKS